MKIKQLSNQTEKIQRWFVFFILSVTFLLSIKQMVPFESVDETMIGNWLWKFHQNPFPVFQYPPLMLYLHFLLSLLYKNILVFLGFINHHSDFFAPNTGYWFTIEAGRIISAFFGTMMVYLAYRIGRRFFNFRVGLVALLLLAFNDLVILHSHIFKTDIPAAFFLTLTLYLLLKFNDSRRLKDLFFTCFVFGLAVGTKYNVISFGFAILLAVLYVWKKEKGIAISRFFWMIPIGSLAGFLTAAPNWLVHPLGNLKVFLKSYNFDSGTVYSFGLGGKSSALQILWKLTLGLIQHFGLFWMIIFLLSLITVWWTREKKEILILTHILFYILVFIQTGFYADRFGLPLYSAVALIIGKTVIIDVPRLFRKYPPILKYGMILFWIGLGACSLINIQYNIKAFNQLRSGLKKDWVRQYRTEHNITNDHFQVARQHQTPKMDRDVWVRKNFRFFSSTYKQRVSVRFVQGLDHVYKKITPEDYFKKKGFLQLNRFTPFYEVKKTKFQTWDYDMLLFYKISPQLKKWQSKKMVMPLPRCYASGYKTSYLPHQVYEKNSNHFVMTTQYANHWIYARQPLSGLSFQIISEKAVSDLTISVNRRTQHIKRIPANSIRKITFPPVGRKAFHMDYTYQIRMKRSRSGTYPPIHVTFSTPLPPPPPHLLMKPRLEKTRIVGDIPMVFSEEPYPYWIKRVYRESEVDLTLLAFLNRTTLYQHRPCTGPEFRSILYPVEKGYFQLSIDTQTASATPPSDTDAALILDTISPDGLNSASYHLDGDEPRIINFRMPSNGFIRVSGSRLEENGVQISAIHLVPDFKREILENYCKK